MWDVWVVWRVCANEYVMLRVKKLYTGWHRFLKTFFLLFCSPVAVYLYTYTRALYIIYKCPTVLFYFFILHFKTVARTRVPGLIAGRRQPPTVVVHRAVLRVAFKIRFRFGMAARGLLHIPVRPTCARRELRRWPTIRRVRWRLSHIIWHVTSLYARPVTAIWEKLETNTARRKGCGCIAIGLYSI
jgi:hypothetical protein